MRIQPSQALAPLLVLCVTSFSACVDDKVVFDDPGDDPGEIPTAAAGFVGYQDKAAQLTFCGTCHVEGQADWKLTGHAKAWEHLQASGHADETCEGCHTTNQYGNVATVTSGFLATRDDRYLDVQCESCHGPGLTHIAAPGNANVPLAPLAVGTALNTGCGECHKGDHSPYLEEWSFSDHTRIAGAASSPSCSACHSGDGALKAWGVNSDWAENAVETGKVAITCAVCHDPHGNQNPGNVRFSIASDDPAENLCMRCHDRTSEARLDNAMPHASQSAVLLGDAGWWPAGKKVTLAVTHGAPEANPGMCASCHMQAFTVTDGSGGFVYKSTGHSFQATPCLDAAGKPALGADCADTQRSFKGCTAAGCHGSEDVARSAMATAKVRTDRLNEELRLLLNQVPASEFTALDNRVSAGEGARFNRELALESGAAIHNPFLIERLLITTIEELQRVYGLSLATGVSLEPAFGDPRD